MTADRPATASAQARLAIFALATGAFGIGTAEFATMGLLPYIADGLGASITEAGHAVSLYAIGVVVGAPLITTLTARLDRKALLLLLVAVFVIGSVGSTLAPTMGTLLLARFVTGLPHGAFLGVAAVVASTLVDPARKGTAMARVMLGLTVANIFGVPAAAAMGAAWGWRTAYGLVAGIGLITLVLVLLLVPRSAPAAQAPSMRGELRTLKRPQVILTLVAGSVGFGGMFAVYTFISPAMTQIAGVPESAMPWVLVCYGVGMTAGSLIVGPLVDRSIDRTALAGIAALGAILLCLGLFLQLTPVALVLLFLMGIGGSIFTSALQVRLLRDTRDAPSLSAAMNHAAFNFANALGAFLGGVVIDAGWGYRAPALVGAGLSVVGLAVTLVAVATRGRSERQIVDTGAAAPASEAPA
ncbi:MFS transporter [Brevibacterium sp. 5221]|uniref:MFS transporter n=1 Tax=Brevibacterium rongguiense TaxID=2695267 RepID=A0A6N9H712_9MICO|nr:MULTISPECIES: MFS transporter [Brevibacterium]MYM19695.1 MFS transporter [Brevibacterium rongguiense]WAL39941.1 MFS transporter [Brevibacterium sp. BRM-1]